MPKDCALDWRLPASGMQVNNLRSPRAGMVRRFVKLLFGSSADKDRYSSGLQRLGPDATPLIGQHCHFVTVFVKGNGAVLCRTLCPARAQTINYGQDSQCIVTL